jgi:hypothetical protein
MITHREDPMPIEFADRAADRHVEMALRNAPPAIRLAVNRSRVAAGLSPVLSASRSLALLQAAGRARAAAELAEIGRPSSTSRTTPPARPAPSRGPLVTRVLMTLTEGDADAAAVGRQLPEAIDPSAFGAAASLGPGWTLRAGHNGPLLAVAGPRLRAHDTPAGLVIEWLPDVALPWAADAVRAIESGKSGVSVLMRDAERKLARLPRLVEVVNRARLIHVALLTDGERPAHPGARAKVYRMVRRDDPDVLRRQLAAAVDNARWFVRRAHAGR